MKRLLPLLLVLCLLLCACGGDSTETSTTTQATTETTEATTETTTEATTEATEPPILYRHPLTGEPLDALWTGRPVAVVINNISAALPHHGTSQADIMYELETEGGITRMLAIFSDLSDVSSIGPVRSARTFFNNIALSHDAPLIHCGGSEFARRGQYSDNSDTISDWNHIDQTYNGSYFYRDSGRRSSGYAYEHTLFTTGEDMLRALEDKGYDITYEDGYDHGLLFDEEATISGETANTVRVIFRGGKKTTFSYNAETNLYEAAQYGDSMVDGNTGETLSFKNVLVIYTEQWFMADSAYYRSFYDLASSGEGLYACGGQIIPIKWSREELRGPITYTLEDGTPLVMQPGTSYVGVVDSDNASTYE